MSPSESGPHLPPLCRRFVPKQRWQPSPSYRITGVFQPGQGAGAGAIDQRAAAGQPPAVHPADRDKSHRAAG